MNKEKILFVGSEVLSKFSSSWESKEKFLETLKVNHKYFEVDASILQRIIQTEKVFILFFSQDFIHDNETRFRETLQFFWGLSEESRNNNKEEGFIAVDLDAVSKEELKIPIPDKTSIYHYSEGELKSMDYKEEIERKERKQKILNYAKCVKQGDENKPKTRGKFFMPCPNFFKGSCSMDYQEWVCSKCKNYIDFGFNNHLYCNCAGGKGTSIEDFEFMCNDPKHGADFVKFDYKCRDYYDEMKPLKNIPIAILGLSGVGKSTWINGILNYLHYKNIEEAKANKILTVVPTKMYITDDNYKTRVISLGTDDNEDTENVGASGTQDCKTYCVRYKDYDIQLIDTPGLGDARGIDQDRKNVKKILDHLRDFEELNGICILLKPNESKITVLLEYCLREILTHLHKDCANNIVFCFTHSRSTFYRPGETLPVLKELLNKIQVDIQINKNTIYCMDNEAYKYLCTLNVKGISYSEREEKGFEQSWNRSVEETKRLLDHVIQLKPHTTEETMTSNQAKRTVLSLVRFAADATHNIEMNIQAVNDQKREIIENLDKQISDLTEEKNKIINIAGKFSWFFERHANSTQDYSFGDYFDYLIDAEENRPDKTEEDKTILDTLKKTKNFYEEENTYLETLIQNSHGTEEYDWNDVKTWTEELYQLPNHGAVLKENMKVVLEAEENVVRHEEKIQAPNSLRGKILKKGTRHFFKIFYRCLIFLSIFIALNYILAK